MKKLFHKTIRTLVIIFVLRLLSEEKKYLCSNCVPPIELYKTLELEFQASQTPSI